MDEWYEELDFEENPFSINPSDFVKNLVARDDLVDELVYRVASGTIAFLEGEEGSGKTSLLRAVIKRFKGRGRVIYVNCDKFKKKLNVEDLLVERNGFFSGKLLRKRPKKMILLLDNVQHLSYKNMERIKNYYDENFLLSVIFTGEDFGKIPFSDSLRQRMEGRVFKIPKMTDKQIVEMVRSRIGDIRFLSDEIITDVAKRSDNNPKRTLRSLDEISEFVVSLEEDIVTKAHVDEVLSGDSSKPLAKDEEESSDDPDKSADVEDVADESEDDQEVELEKYGESDEDDTVSEESASEETVSDSPAKEDSSDADSDAEKESKESKVEEDDKSSDGKEESDEDASVEEDKSEDKGKQASHDESPDDEDYDDIDDFFADLTDDEDDKSSDSKGEPKKEDKSGESHAEEVEDKATVSEEKKRSKQKDLKPVITEDKKEDEDDPDDFFEDDFFADDEKDEEDDYSEDIDVFDEFFEDDDDEEEKDR